MVFRIPDLPLIKPTRRRALSLAALVVQAERPPLGLRTPSPLAHRLGLSFETLGFNSLRPKPTRRDRP